VTNDFDDFMPRLETGNSTCAYRPEIRESAGHLSRLPC